MTPVLPGLPLLPPAPLADDEEEDEEEPSCRPLPPPRVLGLGCRLMLLLLRPLLPPLVVLWLVCVADRPSNVGTGSDQVTLRVSLPCLLAALNHVRRNVRSAASAACLAASPRMPRPSRAAVRRWAKTPVCAVCDEGEGSVGWVGSPEIDRVHV